MGSLPRSRSVSALAGDRPLREDLVSTFADILRSAQHWAASDRPEAVHEFRKAVRRGRSLIRLVRSSAESRKRLRKLDETLRRAHRDTSGLRDAEVLADAAVRAGAPPTRSRELREAGRRAAANRAPLLARVSARLDGGESELAGCLPDQLSLAHLVLGVRKTYKSARRAHSRARVHVPSLHRWRRRTKDLRHQLELLSGLPEISLPLRPKKLRALSTDLGQVTDLLALRDWLHADDSGDTALLATVEARIAANSEAVHAEGTSLFARRPREFAAGFRR